MNQNVVNFFKRNPEAQWCHLVLTTCFHSASVASSYQKNIGAKKVSAFERKEYEQWLAGKNEVAETNTAGEVKEKSEDKED